MDGYEIFFITAVKRIKEDIYYITHFSLSFFQAKDCLFGIIFPLLLVPSPFTLNIIVAASFPSSTILIIHLGYFLKEIWPWTINTSVYLTFSVPENLKNSILEIWIILQSLNIYNWTNTSAKSLNLHVLRKRIKYSLENGFVNLMFTLLFSRFWCSKLGWY